MSLVTLVTAAVVLAGAVATKRSGAASAAPAGRGVTALALAAAQGPRAVGTDSARALIVGTILSNHCRLSPDRQVPVTDYVVRVDQVREGDLTAGDTITVRTLGGLVLLKRNGTEVSEANRLKANAEVRVQMPGGRVQMEGVAETKFAEPQFGRPMLNGQTYLLSVSRGAGAGSFELVAPPEEVK